MDKQQAVKRLQAEISAIATDISNNKDTLADYERYREFLFDLAPASWQVRATFGGGGRRRARGWSHRSSVTFLLLLFVR